MKFHKEKSLILSLILAISLVVLVSAGVFTITLNYPINNQKLSNANVPFNCTGTSTANLVNISFFHNSTGTFHRNETHQQVADLRAYYKLDEVAGSILDSLGLHNGTNNGATAGVVGILGTAYDFESGNTEHANITDIDILRNITVSAWIKPESIVAFGGIVCKDVTNVWCMDMGTTGSIRIRARAQSFEGTTGAISTGEWHHIVFTYNGSDLRLWKDGVNEINQTAGYGNLGQDNNNITLGVLEAGGVRRYDGIIDEVAIFERELTPAEILTLNETTRPLVKNENIFMTNLTSSGIWNCEFCDADGVCDVSATNRTFIVSFVENLVTYNATVTSTSSQVFRINTTIPGTYSSISAKLIYNNTEYSSTLSNGVNQIFTNTLEVPSVSVATDKDFYWAITLDGIPTNTSTNTQTVSPIEFSFCDATHLSPFINISTKEGMNPFPILNASLKVAFQLSAEPGGTTSSYSFEDLSETNNSWTFCSANNNTLYTSAEIEIDGTGYAKNFHYLTDASLNNITSNLTLYLINDSDSTLTELQVVDASQNPLSDVYISIQLYDIGTDTFYTIGMAKTSTDGKDLSYLNWYDSLYKFILVKDGAVIKSTSPYKISETPQIFKILQETIFIFDKFENFAYNLYFNSTSNNFVLTFVKPSGDVYAGCLKVIKRNQTNDYNICNTCETSNSATLYCSVAGYGNGTYVATFYSLGSLKTIDTIAEVIGTANQIYALIGNLDGTVLAIMISGVIMVFFLVSPTLGVIGLILGMLATFALGFQPVDYMTFVGIALLGGLVIWLLRK